VILLFCLELLRGLLKFENMKVGSEKSIFRVFGYKSFFLVNIVILVFLGLSFGREFVRSASFAREMADLEARKDALENKNLSLRNYQDYLSTESFLEKEAREKFGMKKAGETQVFIEDDSIIPSEDVVYDEDMNNGVHFVDSDKAYSNFELWKWYFFDVDRYETEVLE